LQEKDTVRNRIIAIADAESFEFIHKNI